MSAIQSASPTLLHQPLMGFCGEHCRILRHCPFFGAPRSRSCDRPRHQLGSSRTNYPSAQGALDEAKRQERFYHLIAEYRRVMTIDVKQSFPFFGHQIRTCDHVWLPPMACRPCHTLTKTNARSGPVQHTKYNDDFTQSDCFRHLWHEVLAQTINNAITGQGLHESKAAKRLLLIIEARDYLTKPNRGFEDVCHLAGLDPEAVRERAIRLIAGAPPAEALARTSLANRRFKPKKASNIRDAATGGGGHELSAL